jgi:hypothetical protein
MRKFLLGFVAGILTVPATAFVAAWLGLLPINANTRPSELEKTFAHLALDGAAARRAASCESDCTHRGKFDGRNETV